jgi:hypothetical protein
MVCAQFRFPDRIFPATSAAILRVLRCKRLFRTLPKSGSRKKKSQALRPQTSINREQLMLESPNLARSQTVFPADFDR